VSSLDIHDEMRPIFGPLLSDLNAGRQKNILVAGGYGLFLKQSWLLGNPDVPVRQSSTRKTSLGWWQW